MTATKRYGPVELITIEFTTAQPPASVIEAIAAVGADESVALLDLIVVSRAEDGSVDAIEMDELGEGSVRDGIELELAGLASAEDVELIAESLAPGSSALVAAIELTWAARLAQSIADADAVIVSEERIPASAVNEAFSAIQLTDERK